MSNKTKKYRRPNPLTEEEMKDLIQRGNRIGRFARASAANKPKLFAAEVKRIARDVNENTAAKRIGDLERVRSIKRGIIVPSFLEKYVNNKKNARSKNLNKLRQQKYRAYREKLTEEEINRILRRSELEEGEVLVLGPADEDIIFRHWEQERSASEAEQQRQFQQLAESSGRYGPGLNPRHMIFKGQTLPAREEIDTSNFPTPAWLARLTTNIETARDYIVGGIVPFELIDNIRCLVSPTRDQLYKQRANRAQRKALTENAIQNMEELLVKLQRVTQQDPRYKEVKRFARVLLNYYVSEEAPGQMQTTAARVSPEQEFISMSQGDEPNYDRKTTHRRSGREVDKEFRDLQPMQLKHAAQNLINMAGEADDILRGGYGVNARFAIWSPYGPGARNLTRLFLIYDGVIEPAAAARLMDPRPGANVELIDALTVLTNNAKDRTIVADAVAEVVVTGRQSSSVVEARLLDQTPIQGWVPAFPGQVQWEPSIGVSSRAESRGELLNIPIRDAYMAWEAALWTQSHLRHEAQIEPDILAAHCRMIEFNLGHSSSIGIQNRRCLPTFYQLSVEQPLRESYNIMARVCSTAKSSLSSAASSVCSMFRTIPHEEGVRIEPVRGRGIPAPAQLDFFARLMNDARLAAIIAAREAAIAGTDAVVKGSVIASNAARVATIAGTEAAVRGSARASRASRAIAVDVGENAMALSGDVAESLHDYGAAAASHLHERGVNASQRIGTSVDTGLDRFYDAAEEFRENGISDITIAISEAANNTSNRAGDLRSHLQQVSMPHIAASSIEASNRVQILAGGGGSITVLCNNNSVVDSPVIMTVSPIVQVQDQSSSIIPVPAQITTVDNQQILVEQIADAFPGTEELLVGVQQGLNMKQAAASNPQAAAAVTEITQILQNSNASGIKYKGKKRRGNGTKKRGKGRGTSHKSMPPTNNTMRILKQKLKL